MRKTRSDAGRPRLPMEDDAWFWARVARGTGCWTHTGLHAPRARVVWDPREQRGRVASRIAWELAYGPIPVGLGVCHHCDNPHCVRPDHLFLGTQRDNMQDAAKKGRHRSVLSPETVPRGEAHWKAKLTRREVHTIRALHSAGTRVSVIARKFGVRSQSISNIVARRAWAWVE